MKAFCFTLTILCAVQSILAYPRPDFAINGAVSGSGQVKTASLDLGTEVAKTGQRSVDLASGYTLLTTISANLEAIGDAIAAPGVDLATALNSLAGDMVGPVAIAFDGVIAKVDAFTAVLSGTFDGKLAAIETDTGVYIGKQFADAFRATGTTLNQLKTALTTLKSDVQAARTAAGSSSTVSSAIIRSKIPTRSVNNVLTQIRQLRATVPLITFVVNSSLDNLKMVDDFIIAMKEEVVRGAAAYVTSFEAFKINLEAEPNNIKTKVETGLGEPIANLISTIKNELDTVAKFTEDLAPKVTALETVFTTSVTAKLSSISNAFGTYSSNVPTLIENLQVSLGESLCSPIKAVSLVQIANAGFSDFCFSKYSPRVFAQVSLTIDAFDVCFEKEVSRLLFLETVILSIAEQIAYNVADLFDNLSICLALPDANKGACFTMLTPYYDNLATKSEAHLSTVANLVAAETKASFNRLGACLHNSLSATTLAATDIASLASSCLTSGPQP
ncbi:uncharacterized protein LOC118517123 [Anopheles stephensi]|uniref:uncharacterized protein LOC118513713 n=1 Tax=Anopheles stephensi TaxID=30069 RepID=UPI001658901D|nr:uncharacterized protein LOC118513713 [Anopheles stephensi]XP_035918880.1 uncharacterized protein LOC118517123 [Anopheles stephensi]